MIHNGEIISVIELTDTKPKFHVYNKKMAEQYSAQLVVDALLLEAKIEKLQRRAAMMQRMAQEWQLAADQLQETQSAS
jgi:hypothetical protein